MGAQAFYVYVDNLGVIAKKQQEADIVLEQWKKLFTENGLSLHKSELSQKIESLGVELDGLSLCCPVRSKRFWTLRRALDEILRRRKITGRALEIVVGHITFSVPDLRYAHCTRVIVSCAHVITWRLASGQKPGPNWLRFGVF